MNDIKIGIVGCGRIGTRHAGHASRVGELKAVCDTNIESADKLATEHSCSSYHNIQDMLEAEKDLDVIAVCTPNGLHAEHTIAILKNGHHVLCEKPMALTVSDCIEMIREAENNNRRLFIVKQNRYNPPVAALKQLIDDGKLGKIYSVHLNCFWNRNDNYFKDSWKGTKDLDGGTLFTQFSHFIDLLYWVIGDIVEVKALTDNIAHKDNIEFEDQCGAIMRFANGALGTASFSINSYKKNMEGSITIFAEKGTIKVGGQYLNELEYQMIENGEIKDLPEGNPANNYGTYVGSMSNHEIVYENVVDVLRNGGSIKAIGIEGMKTVEIVESIYRAAKNG
jgi:UDP-N-acetyl-2-amino-2-deoxyglucuronate dehydrogenase